MGICVLIDGYNMIKGTPRWSSLASRSLEEAREAMLKALVAYRRVRGHPVIVVFDGKEHQDGASWHRVFQGVGVVFSRPRENADEVLKRLALKKRDGCVVVTSDRDVQRFAERAGATAISCEEFEQRLVAAAAGVNVGDVEERDTEEEGASGSRQRLLTKKRGNPSRKPRRERKAQERLRKL